MAKQKMTIDDLAVVMGERFDATDKKTSERFDVADKKTSERFDVADKTTDKKIESLAIMVANGFSDIIDRFDKRFVNLENGQKVLQIDVKNIRTDVNKLRTEMHDEFRRIHEEINDIKVKLDQLSKRTLEDDDALNKEILTLHQRVATLEKQFKQFKSARV